MIGETDPGEALRDSSNHTYTTGYLIQTDKSIHAFPYVYTTTQPGDKVSGVVVFEVPQNAKLTTLTYDDHPVVGPYGDYTGKLTVKV